MRTKMMLHGVRVVLTGAASHRPVHDYDYAPLKTHSYPGMASVLEVKGGDHIAIRVQNDTPTEKWVEVRLDGQQAATRFLFPWESHVMSTWGWRGSSSIPLKVEIADIKASGPSPFIRANPDAGTIHIQVQDVLKLATAQPLTELCTSYSGELSAPSALSSKEALKVGLAAVVPVAQKVAANGSSAWQISGDAKEEYTWAYKDALGLDLLRAQLRAQLGLPAASSTARSVSSSLPDHKPVMGTYSTSHSSAMTGVGTSSSAMTSALGKRKADESRKPSSKGVNAQSEMTMIDMTQSDDEEHGGMAHTPLKKARSSYREIPMLRMRVCANDGSFATIACAVPDDARDDGEVLISQQDEIQAGAGGQSRGGSEHVYDTFTYCLLAEAGRALQFDGDAPGAVLWSSEGEPLHCKVEVRAVHARNGVLVVGRTAREAFCPQADLGEEDEEV